MDGNLSLQNVNFQMAQRWACLIHAFMLSLTVFSTLLVLKKLFSESALTGLLPEIPPNGQREIRQAEGFEAQRGDLVLELAKVLTKKIMMIKVMTMNVMMIMRLVMMNVIMMNVMTTFEVVALPPLVGTNMGCKPPDLQRRLILTS